MWNSDTAVTQLATALLLAFVALLSLLQLSSSMAANLDQYYPRLPKNAAMMISIAIMCMYSC